MKPDRRAVTVSTLMEITVLDHRSVRHSYGEQVIMMSSGVISLLSDRRAIRSNRGGVTLIEVLVVVAIISVLIGLLTPAVQKVRETSARIRCVNNLKQVSLAMHLYADANTGLPPGLTAANNQNSDWVDRPDRTGDWGPGWGVLILPYIEQDSLYAQIAPSVNANLSNTPDQGWRAVCAAATVPTYLCPSDAANRTPYLPPGPNGAPSWARGNYAANYGPQKHANGGSRNGTSDGQDNTSWTKPVINGSPASGLGPMWVTSKLPHRCMCVERIPDGSSNTVLVTEVRSGRHAKDARGVWALGLIGSSAVMNYGTGSGDALYVNDPAANSDDVFGCVNEPQFGMGCWESGTSTQATPRSSHPGGANAAMADGSVRFLTNLMSPAVLYLLGSANDGQPPPPDN